MIGHRAAAQEDVEEIATLIWQSFAGRWAPYMIITQSGLVNYLRSILRNTAIDDGHEIRVAIEHNSSRVAGYADFRLLGDAVGHVSYVAVAPVARGQGVAQGLIDHLIASHPELTRIDLDVFEDNFPARQLYARNGFQEMQRTLWMRRAIPRPALTMTGADCRFKDEAYEHFGFCRLVSNWDGSEYEFGRIGPHVLNCITVDAFTDTSHLAAMRGTMPELREAMVIVATGSSPKVENDGKLIGASIRMSRLLSGRST